MLFPFTVLYAGMMRLRNQQFNNGSRHQSAFDRVVISVGNLSTGGTGKTPMIELLIKLLKSKYQLATVSRGYGRKTKGERIATETDTARTLGDEPFQFYKKFGDDIKVVVGEERILAIPHLLMDYPDVELILMDDAYQHRKVARDMNLLLSDYSAPFYNDYVLPTGNLRESRAEAKRASAIVITKCPQSIDQTEKKRIEAEVRTYNLKAPIFFSHIKYGELKPVFEVGNIEKEVAVISAIAKPKPFYNYLDSSFKITEKFEYIDHYNFKSSDLDRVFNKLKGRKLSLITTEKDMVRLLPFQDHSLFRAFNLFYLPIEMEIDKSAEFEKMLMDGIEVRKHELNS